jgi:hypothetical protein
VGEGEKRGGEPQRACGCGAWWHGCGRADGLVLNAVVGVEMEMRFAEDMG